MPNRVAAESGEATVVEETFEKEGKVAWVQI